MLPDSGNSSVPTAAPTAPFAFSLMEVNDKQMAAYADLIYRRTGIRLVPQKKALLANRLRRRLSETGIAGFDAYYEHIRRLPPNDPEWDAFLQEITTHETYLFRDENHWQWFREKYLPQCSAEALSGKRPKSLRIWSAACSTGDEAFTIACCIAACLPNFQQWQIRIVGTDIGCGAVMQAKTARFTERSMNLVSQSYRQRFFNQIPGASSWQAKPVLTSMTSFRTHNLLDPLAEKPFDVVFLKNVLIYFSPESKRKAVENIRPLISPGGILVAGAAEGIGDLFKDYQRIQPWLYQRPGK